MDLLRKAKQQIQIAAKQVTATCLCLMLAWIRAWEIRIKNMAPASLPVLPLFLSQWPDLGAFPNYACFSFLYSRFFVKSQI